MTSEQGQNPAAQADTLPGKDQGSAGEGSKDGKPKTPGEIMREDVSPQDEQGNRPPSDQPHISG
nr:hypothetical protein [Cupriavidus gilardii]